MLGEPQFDPGQPLTSLFGPGSAYDVSGVSGRLRALTGPGSLYDVSRGLRSWTGPGSPYYNATHAFEPLTGPGSTGYYAIKGAESLTPAIRDQLVNAIASQPKAIDHLATGMLPPAIRDQLVTAIASQPRAIDHLATRMLPSAIRDQLVRAIADSGPIDQMRIGLPFASPYSQLTKMIAGLAPIDQMRIGLAMPSAYSHLARTISGQPRFDEFASGRFGGVHPNEAADLSDELSDDGIGDDELVVVDDAETANSLLEWLRDHRPTCRQVESLCRWLTLLHALIMVAQWKAGLELSPVVEHVEIESELFLALIGFVLPLT